MKVQANSGCGKEQLLYEFQDVFNGLGCLPGDFWVGKTIKPTVVQPCRFPVVLIKKIKE